MDLENRLETAKRAVRDAEQRLERQREIVAELEKHGHSTLAARTLLDQLQQALENHQMALRWLRQSNTQP